MLFVGVTTGQSAAHHHFPAWCDALGVPPGRRLEGVDIPVGSPADACRAIVRRLRDDPAVAGALVTSHKIAIHDAAADLLDGLDALATLCAEVGCVSRASGRLVGHALDPITSIIALDRIAPASHWRMHPRAQVTCLGAGGAGVALAMGLAGRIGSAPGPARLVIADRLPARVDHAIATMTRAGAPSDWATGIATAGDPARADSIVDASPPGSVIINATGMGKDVPGSPISDGARFPEGGVAWDLNYRGDRPFLAQARARARASGIVVADGWDYFATSWALHVARVFGVAEAPEALARAVAATVRR